MANKCHIRKCTELFTIRMSVTIAQFNDSKVSAININTYSTTFYIYITLH